MNASRVAHDRAMDLAFLADRARSQGKLDDAKDLYAEALECEVTAIRELGGPIEPTYSVLHRSAAWLALDSGNPRLAEKFAAAGLAGDPPDEIAEELRDVWEQAIFRRHLDLRGIELHENEIQISLSGPGIGWGVTEWGIYSKRVNDSLRMMTRIAERQADKPFRERGPAPKEIKNLLSLHVSVPRAASYAVTLRLGQQLSLPIVSGLPEVPDVVDEFMDIVDLVNLDKMEELDARIPDNSYRTNAISLAKQIAPDGRIVRQVGFTIQSMAGQRMVGFTRWRKDVVVPRAATSTQGKAIKVKGILLYANAIANRGNTIRVVDQSGKSHLFAVSPEMMDDIVKPMWNAIVTVHGERRGKKVFLLDIEEEE